MMNRISLMLLIGCCLMAAQAVGAQERTVKVLRFEIDKKAIEQPFKISLTVKGKTVEAKTSKDGFVLPADLSDSETIDVKFESGKYNLLFESVPMAKFKMDWIFGIDTNPYEPENMESVEPDPPGKELSGIYYLAFQSSGAPDTRMVVKEFQ